MNRLGKADLRSLIAETTGPCEALDWEPVGSFAEGWRGTPKRMTDLRPFWTRGVR